jgi:hypothetical protein
MFLIALVSACTSGDPAPRTAGTSSAAPPSGEVDCEHSIATIKAPTPGTRVVLGVVALPVDVLQPVPVDGRFWSKRGLEVLSGAVAEISIAPEAAGHAWIEWGNPPEPATVQRVNGCPVPGCAAGCGWLAFAGGYWVDAPTCVPIVVRSNDREARVGVAVGAACD